MSSSVEETAKPPNPSLFLYNKPMWKRPTMTVAWLQQEKPVDSRTHWSRIQKFDLIKTIGILEDGMLLFRFAPIGVSNYCNVILLACPVVLEATKSSPNPNPRRCTHRIKPKCVRKML
jgi:hypothetical protein